MISVEIKVPKHLRKGNLFNRLAKRMPAAMRQQMKKALAQTERDIKIQLNKEFPRSRQLKQSFHIHAQLNKGADQVEGKVTSPVVYAKVQDVGTGYLPGGVIRPKPPLKRLAIPLDKSLKEAGIWPRHYRRALDFVPGRKGKPVLVDVITGIPMYVLVPYTRIQGKKYLMKAGRRFRPKIRKLLGEKALEKAAGEIKAAKAKA